MPKNAKISIEYLEYACDKYRTAIYLLKFKNNVKHSLKPDMGMLLNP